MRWSMCLCLAVALAKLASGEDIAFRDGRVWLDARVVTRESTYVIVRYNDSVQTVHATEVLPGCAELLKIRAPTPEEIAERQEREKQQREAASARATETDKVEAEARERAAEIQAARAATPAAAQRVVTNSAASSIHPGRPGSPCRP